MCIFGKLGHDAVADKEMTEDRMHWWHRLSLISLLIGIRTAFLTKPSLCNLNVSRRAAMSLDRNTETAIAMMTPQTW